MSSKSPGILEPLRVRVRRLQFIVGLGFTALVIGTFVTAALRPRLEYRLQDLPWFIYEPVMVSLKSLWVLGALPVLCYGAARILELKPLATAVGAASSGGLFLCAILSAAAGLEGLWGGWSSALLHSAAFAGGVMLSYRAVVNGRAAAAQGAAKAQSQAEARKAEYMQFLNEAERGAEKSAQREAERTAAAASTVASPEASAAPVSVSAAPTEAPPSAEGAPSASSSDMPAETKPPPAEG